ncbi:hypothetical protein [Roseovarius aestuariivivens]|uniref:hypothetical protein n=1 Tax=Roseovarius aestuariivivens TaxID=1888910 RepID=UPI0010815BF7|nr:hypothetical protein [Roseovarius aestuariivivens]
MSIRLSELLRQVDPKTEEKIKSAYRRANTSIRYLLRDRTRLSLSVEIMGERRISQVPIRILPGMPTNLEDIEFDDDIDTLLRLAKIRKLIEYGAADWDRYHVINRDLSHAHSLGLESLPDNKIFGHAQRFRELLELLETRDPVKKILNVADDVLGTYSYRTKYLDEESGEVTLYWGVIGLVSDLLGVHVEDLAIVVLTHELAHAYTHQGAEIDGMQWSSDRFGSSDVNVVEGLAQYFTHLCLSSKKDSLPGAREAFEKLRQKQPECYSAHLPWIENFSAEHVRRAMLEARRFEYGVSHEIFGGLLDDANAALSQA